MDSSFSNEKAVTIRKRIEEKMIPIFWPNLWSRRKINNPSERYITTTFCYGCNLGPTQTARSLGNMDRKHISWINDRHVTEENIHSSIILKKLSSC